MEIPDERQKDADSTHTEGVDTDTSHRSTPTTATARQWLSTFATGFQA